MATYDRYPAVDENYNFPDPVYNRIHRAKILGPTTNLDSLDTGVYFRVGSIATEQGWPVSRSSGSAVVEVHYDYGTNGVQTATHIDTTGAEHYARRRLSGNWTAWEQMNWWKQPITGSTDIDALTTPGRYPMQFARTASELGIPVADDVIGDLEVTFAGSASNARQIFRGTVQTSEVWERSSLARVWGEWRPGDPAPRVLTAASDLTDLHDGTYIFSSTTVPDALGIPTGATGVQALGEFSQRSLYPGSRNYAFQEYRGISGKTLTRSKVFEEYSPWEEKGSGASYFVAPPPSPSHEMRVQAFKDEYPLVSTAGKAAVVFRYDHGLTNIKNTLLSLHEQYDIPLYIAMNSRLWDIEENSGASQADAQAWIASGLVEFGNHTSDHRDRNTDAGIYDTIVNGRKELESQLGVTIHGFTVPGVTEYDKFGGFGGGSLNNYSDTYAGGLILANHAIASGVVGSNQRVMDGQVRQAGRHFGWETRSWSQIKEQIDQAISLGTALTLMSHPRLLGIAGYFDAALAEQVIGYVRERIDAGDLANISYYQSHHATTGTVS